MNSQNHKQSKHDMAHQHVREAVKKAYPSRKWARKVDAMSDAQVIAIYTRLCEQNVIKEKS